eukprot:2223753-Rhodomonas_salina.1
MQCFDKNGTGCGNCKHALNITSGNNSVKRFTNDVHVQLQTEGLARTLLNMGEQLKTYGEDNYTDSLYNAETVEISKLGDIGDD